MDQMEDREETKDFDDHHEHEHEQHYKSQIQVNYDFSYLTTKQFPNQLVHVSFTFW